VADFSILLNALATATKMDQPNSGNGDVGLPSFQAALYVPLAFFKSF
jgi:hypothetical protein